jgi:hypothetical protein
MARLARPFSREVYRIPICRSFAPRTTLSSVPLDLRQRRLPVDAQFRFAPQHTAPDELLRLGADELGVVGEARQHRRNVAPVPRLCPSFRELLSLFLCH